MHEEPNEEQHAQERAVRDLDRPPRARKHREIVLTSGERVKRTDIGWSKKEEAEDSRPPKRKVRKQDSP